MRSENRRASVQESLEAPAVTNQSAMNALAVAIVFKHGIRRRDRQRDLAHPAAGHGVIEQSSQLHVIVPQVESHGHCIVDGGGVKWRPPGGCQQRRRRVSHLISGVVEVVVVVVVRIIDGGRPVRRVAILFAVRVSVLHLHRRSSRIIAWEEFGDIQDKPRQLSWKTPPSPGEDSGTDAGTEGELLQDRN